MTTMKAREVNTGGKHPLTISEGSGRASIISRMLHAPILGADL